jgi:hypothetical protein
MSHCLPSPPPKPAAPTFEIAASSKQTQLITGPSLADGSACFSRTVVESYSGFSSASRAAMPSSLLRLLQRGRTSSKPIKVKPSEESPSGKVCRTLGWRRGDEQAAQGDGAVGRMQQGYLVRLVGCGLFLHKLDRFLNVSLCLSVRDVSL